MGDRKSFLLRLPPDLLRELELWAKDELRSVNAQIEFVLRRAVRAERGGPDLELDVTGGGGADAPSAGE